MRRIPKDLAWADLAACIGGRRLAVFLDYDGTLTPIAPRPELATLSQAARDAVERIAGVWPVFVISGRDVRDVASRVGLDGIVYIGNHGFEAEGPGIEEGPACIPADLPKVLTRVGGAIADRLSAISGAVVEVKRYAVAVHYRLVAADRVAGLLRVVNAFAEREAGLKVAVGKKVIELRPAIAWDKGMAVSWALETLELDGEDVMPLFIGDDRTDEDAFRALRRARRGVGVLVSETGRPSFAHWRLANPAAVLDLLEKLTDYASRPAAAAAG